MEMPCSKKKVCTYFSPKMRALQSFAIYENDNTVSDCRRLKFSTYYMVIFIAYYHSKITAKISKYH